MKKTVILAVSIVFLYLLISLYFTRHFFFHTVINGVNASFVAYDDADELMKSHMKDYKLQLTEKDGKIEVINGQDIQIRYNTLYNFSEIHRQQKPFRWLWSLFRRQIYEDPDLFHYNQDDLNSVIARLDCINLDVIKSRNAGFIYSNGTYVITKEIYGNEIDKDRFIKTINRYIARGKTKLDLNENRCYKVPKYTVNSEKTLFTKSLLDQYVSAKIIYLFGSNREILDGTTISRWIQVDDNLDVTISEAGIKNYMKALCSKYDTVGIARDFRTSAGTTIKIEGGLYGWKINQKDEAEVLTNHIKQGNIIEKEPLYAQKASSRDSDDIGSTYVEISITRQQLWFYKDGKLIIQGPVVTGNPNRGNSTVTGIYMLNYKQKDTSLEGAGYSVKVTYWMPFYGNMGIHDASWRYSFGGEIYKRNGTHGCVNAPFFLAKAIFENIDEEMPIIIYKD